MARYSRAFKAKAVARLLPPESASLEDVSREIGVRVDTLSRWRAEALSESQDRLWTGAARLEAVIHTASLDERVRQGHVRSGFDLLNLQDAQIRLPAVILEQWVIIRTAMVPWDQVSLCGPWNTAVDTLAV